MLLLADTGRLVGTGCSGPMAARMAILKAARQLANEANVYVHIRKFSVSQISHRTCTLLVHSILFLPLGTLVAMAMRTRN